MEVRDTKCSEHALPGAPGEWVRRASCRTRNRALARPRPRRPRLSTLMPRGPRPRWSAIRDCPGDAKFAAGVLGIAAGLGGERVAKERTLGQVTWRDQSGNDGEVEPRLFLGPRSGVRGQWLQPHPSRHLRVTEITRVAAAFVGLASLQKDRLDLGPVHS